MKCPLCKGDMLASKTNLTYEIGEDHIVVIKDVPALVCKQCGEDFIGIEAIREVEKIVSTAKENGVTFGLMQYKEAA